MLSHTLVLIKDQRVGHQQLPAVLKMAFAYAMQDAVIG
jgi:hypothetical protein